MAVRTAVGRLDPVVYFENARGEISLPPTTEHARRIKDRMNRMGWELREASSLEQIDALQHRMEQDQRRKMEGRLEHEEYITAYARRAVRDRLVARMTSGSTPAYERDFIKAYLMLADEKREKYRQRYLADQSYFFEREHNNSLQAMQDMANKVSPDSGDTACTRCRNYRRVQGATICARCASEMAQAAVKR